MGGGAVQQQCPPPENRKAIMKIHYFCIQCPDMKEGDTYTLDPEEVTCPTCRPRRVEQCACYEYEGDNPDCPVHPSFEQEYADNAPMAMRAHVGL